MNFLTLFKAYFNMSIHVVNSYSKLNLNFKALNFRILIGESLIKLDPNVVIHVKL